MESVATTDHGFVFGAFDFWNKARNAGVKPIIGVEAYLTPGTARRTRPACGGATAARNDVSGAGAYTHMTMWAETTEGMHNLFRLSSLASLEGYLYKPRMDRDLLADLRQGPHRHHRLPLRRGPDQAAPGPLQGGDAGGVGLPGHLRQGELLLRTDGPRPGHRAQRPRRTCCKLARELELPLVATNDLHYTHAEDAKSHAALLCVQSGSTLADPKRFKFDCGRVLPEVAGRDARDLPGLCPRPATTPC